MALALPTMFAACTAEDVLEQGSSVNMAARKAVGEISFINSDIQSRLVYNNGLKWTETDKLGAALMDEWKGTTTPETPSKDYQVVDKIYSNYQYDYDGTGFSNGNAVLVEGNYFVYAQFNKNQKRSGLAYSIEANQETGTGYDAWYKNQFFLDHIFVKQGDSQVGVNVLPVFPKVNMSIAYEGANNGVEVRKVIVKDATKKFALEGAIVPSTKTGVNYSALANVTPNAVSGKNFKASDYTVTNGTLADVFNAYKKALKDCGEVFTLGENESILNFVSPNVVDFIGNTTLSENMTLHYTTPAASVKGVMILPLSEAHDAANLVFEVYTNKGLVTIAGTDITMSSAFTFSGAVNEETGNVKDYEEITQTGPAYLLINAANDIRYNDGIQKAFVAGMAADGLQKVEIGFKDNAILVPNTLTVSTTEELEYYLANWYTGKKDQIVSATSDKNTVTVIAAPAEGQKVEINNTVLAFVKNANNPNLKFEGSIEIKAGTNSEAINYIAKADNNLSVVNYATQVWTATQSFTSLTNKGTLTVGTGVTSGASADKATYTVTNAIVNEGTLTVKKALAGANKVYNVGTLNVNANLTALVNGSLKDAPAATEIIATAAANLTNAATVSALNNYATVDASNATIGTLTNNATVNVDGTLKVTGVSVNKSAIAIAENSVLRVTGKFENAAEATITNNSSLNVSTANGELTNNGKIINNGEASCNADGAKFINNADIDAKANSITLVSLNNAGAEILVADNTALVTIPNASTSEGKVTFIVDEQADLAVIPSCANSLRVTAATIDLRDAKPSTQDKDDITMTSKKHIEFRSKVTMNITYFGDGTTFENVYFNADGATSEVRFNTYGNLTASKSLTLSKNAMVIVNNNLNYQSNTANFKNEGRLYVIGMLKFLAISKPSTEGLAFMGNVYCTGGETANISWPASDAATIQEAIVASSNELAAAVTNGVSEVTLAQNVEMTESLNFNVLSRNAEIKKITLNLNGKTLKNDVTDVIVVNSGVELTITGNGTVLASTTNQGNGGALWVKGGHVIIKNGTFKTGGDGSDRNDCVCVRDGGYVRIEGGEFEYTGTVTSAQQNTSADGNKFLLNLKDDGTDGGTGNQIIVAGGKFWRYNPAASTSEPGEGNTSFLQLVPPVASYPTTVGEAEEATPSTNVYNYAWGQVFYTVK